MVYVFSPLSYPKISLQEVNIRDYSLPNDPNTLANFILNNVKGDFTFNSLRW